MQMGREGVYLGIHLTLPDKFYIFSDGGWVSGVCTGYFSSFIHTKTFNT